MSSIDPDAPLFALLHGSWHGAWCWDDLSYELLGNGYESIAVDMPNDIPGATFEDCRDEALAQIEQAAEGREVIVVAHSRAANIAPRLPGPLAVKHLVYLCGSFEQATLDPVLENAPLGMETPQKYTKAMQTAYESDEWGMSRFDYQDALHFFFHDCAPEVRHAAASQLRYQYRSPAEEPLESWPSQDIIPQTYIMATQDRVISPEWSSYVARHLLRIPLVSIDSGHSPFYSRPKDLASMLIALTTSSSLPRMQQLTA